MLSAAQLRQRFPALDTGRYYPPRALDDERFWDGARGEVRALWTPDGGYVHDPQLATQNLMHAARAEGARLVLGAEIVAIETSGGRVTGLRTADGSVITAPVVVNAAGPHSGHVNDLAGVRGEFAISTRPLRQEVHHVAPPAAGRFPVSRTSATPTSAPTSALSPAAGCSSAARSRTATRCSGWTTRTTITRIRPPPCTRRR